MNRRSIKERVKAKRTAIKQRSSVLPLVEGPNPCPDCWTAPGETHQLSCEQVTVEQFMAVLDGAK